MLGIVVGLPLGLLWCLLSLHESRRFVIDSSCITVTFINFKTWTVHYNWEDYYEVEIRNDRKGMRGLETVLNMVCRKVRRHPSELIFPGTDKFPCTLENYELIKSWGTKDMKISEVTKF